MAYFCYSDRSVCKALKLIKSSPKGGLLYLRLLRSAVCSTAFVCMSGSAPLAVLGLVAFLLTFLLSCLVNSSTVALSFLEVSMIIKHLLIAFLMFGSGVAINLFSTAIVSVQT